MGKKPKSVEEYLWGFPPGVRKKLAQMRALIRRAAPQAEEMISYNMPLYKWNGVLVSFAAWKEHISLYPAPRATGDLKEKLTRYKGAKATLRFPMDEPLPLGLIAKVVKLRVREKVKSEK